MIPAALQLAAARVDTRLVLVDGRVYPECRLCGRVGMRPVDPATYKPRGCSRCLESKQ